MSNFLEKNKDTLHDDIQSVLRESNTPMVANMFAVSAEAVAVSAGGAAGRRTSTGSGGGKASKKTLGGQFKQQLTDLMQTLNTTYPHFVRCMKPNDNRAGNQFNSSRMQDQLRYAGLVEVCRIRKLGYPVRREFEAFYKRYRCCDPSAGNLDNLLRSLTAKGVLVDGEWQKGYTKVFCRTQQSADLELAREAAFLVVVRSVQKEARRMVYLKRYRNYLKLLQSVKDAVAKREIKVLTSALEASTELPFGGGHLALIKSAKLLQSRIKEEIRVTKLLEEAIKAHEINALKNAVSAARGMNPVFETPLVADAQKIIDRLTAEAECRAGLIAAMEAKSRQGLADYIEKCASMDYSCNELKQAVALLARLKEEDAALARLQIAVNNKNLDSIRDAISECAEMGLETPEVDRAQELYTKLQAELQARIAAENAEKARIAGAFLGYINCNSSSTH